MNRLLLYFSLILTVSFTACSRAHYQFETIAKKPIIERSGDFLSTYDIDINVNYVSSDLDLSVFQVDVYNNTKDTIKFTADAINLFLNTDFYSDGIVLKPLEKDFLIEEYSIQSHEIQKAKKRNTFWNILSSGLSVVSLATTSGAFSFNTVGFALESTAYILEDRNYFNALSGSIEERILYIEDWVLDELSVAPGQEGAFDVLFEHAISDGECTLEIKVADHTYQYPYDLRTSRVER